MPRKRRSAEMVGIMRSAGLRICAAAAAALAAMTSVGVCTAVSAPQPCPDIEVVFARGTFEAPGVGATGSAFIDAIRTRIPGSTLAVHSVNYPASLDFRRAVDGIVDVSQRLRQLSETCPDINVVLGGYSQGAAVAAYSLTERVPQGYSLPPGIAGPLSVEVAARIAAVVLFGKPSEAAMRLLGGDAPPMDIGSVYRGRMIELCAPYDPVCSPEGLDRTAHSAYSTNGMTQQAADFVVNQLTKRA